MARRACLTIGVSTVVPLQGADRFGFLDGAAIAARKIGEWALRSGYANDDVRIVTDEEVDGTTKPVTRERVQQAVDELFPPNAQVVEHLIVSFCGHGLTDANFKSICWLFSDSLRGKYRVRADAFCEELEFHGVERITLISDACREAPKTLDLMRFEAVRGITVHGKKVDGPIFDRLVACQDGQLGYMLLDRAAAKPGKCVFSGVVLDVLWGMEPAAIQNGVITIGSFGLCVKARTGERAKYYNLKLNPDCAVAVETAVLYDTAKPPRPPHDLQPWPRQSVGARMGVGALRGIGTPAENFQLLETDETFRTSILGPDFGKGWPELAAAPSRIALPEHSKDLVQDLVALRSPLLWMDGSIQEELRQHAVVRLEAEAAAHARDLSAEGIPRRMAQLAAEAASGTNLIIAGRTTSIWARSPLVAFTQTAARTQAQIDESWGVPVLVEFADATFAPVVPYAGRNAIVGQDDFGNVVIAYGDSGSPEAFAQALAAIADFTAGRLSAESIDRLAALLRLGKHLDPVLGAICAYLYKAVADIDSIRRMAFFYAQHEQPVPYDIALLGAMHVKRDNDGSLVLSVPEVKPRKHGDAVGNLPDFVTMGTPARVARIGGLCPWLALGWDYVSLSRPEWTVLVDGLAEHASEIARNGFTSLPPTTGQALARMWKLQTFGV